MNPYKFIGAGILLCLLGWSSLFASSHREAPLIANDPLADNTDVYAFRSPDDPNTVTLIANYVPFQLPHGGPNYYQFGENIRYEIHVDNDVSTQGDDIIYRFTFTKANQDPTTFFNIRLGAENLMTTYTVERSTDGGASFHSILSNGVVPPYNIGPRSIESPVGLGAHDYASLVQQAIHTTSDGEKIFAGPSDDPFFVDLGGVFDLGDTPRQNGRPKDGVACLNVSTIAIQVPISLLQKDGKDVSQAQNILDGDFVIGVWASASRQQIRTLNTDGSSSYSGNWVQVSRLGMPLTNEAVIPIGDKDEWNARTPYNENPAHFEYFFNPELGLYMDDALFGGAVPAFSPLRIQRNSLGAFDFGNGNDGLFGLKGSAAVAGTALDDAIFGTLLLPDAGKPRSVDLWPTFHTGVPNLAPYQLATGKNGNPLANGKPFINNFLPNGGDMLRLNMATPITDRHDPGFSSLGLVAAAASGLVDPNFASSPALEFIPNMDGFPNGRRLEDDVTRIELQAVSGIVLAAIGLWYDDFDPNDPNASPVTQDLLNVLTYTTGIEANDADFRRHFPYVQLPWSGTGKCSGEAVNYTQPDVLDPTQAISSFTLVNAGNNQDVQMLEDGDTLYIDQLPRSTFSVRANANPQVVGSVKFQALGQSRVENVFPYSLFGDRNGNYTGIPLTPGSIQITATPFSRRSARGTAGVPLSISLTILQSANQQAVNSFTLVNARNNQDIGPLTDGMTIDLASLPSRRLNVRANTNPQRVGSVKFESSRGNRTENVFPYALGGDRNGNYFDARLRVGTHRIKATPYSRSSARGDRGMSLEITIHIVDSRNSSYQNDTNLEGPTLSLYPNPVVNELQLSFENVELPGSVQLIDLTGKVLLSRTYDPAKQTSLNINVSEFPAGIYLIKTQSGNWSKVEQIVKQ
ncbi:MAG: DUF4331 family protein [Bacteroidia bacterium]|nr:DUF4331 family protein [Bacteroidia bacterium]